MRILRAWECNIGREIVKTQTTIKPPGWPSNESQEDGTQDYRRRLETR